jgi:hypothetical protein
MTRRGDKLDPRSPQFAARQARWGHNALFGHLARAKILVMLVLQRESTTPEAKQIAVRIEQDLEFLETALKTRIDKPTNHANNQGA